MEGKDLPSVLLVDAGLDEWCSKWLGCLDVVAARGSTVLAGPNSLSTNNCACSGDSSRSGCQNELGVTIEETHLLWFSCTTEPSFLECIRARWSSPATSYRISRRAIAGLSPPGISFCSSNALAQLYPHNIACPQVGIARIDGTTACNRGCRCLRR